MKPSNPLLLASSLMLATSLTFVAAAPARADAGVAESAASQTTEKLPDTAASLWKAIDAKTTELKKTIDAGSLANVHHEAYAVRDLAAALPAHSPNLTDTQKFKVQADVKFVATLAERLDASGDANDKAGTQSNYDKLMKVLADLKTVYANSK